MSKDHSELDIAIRQTLDKQKTAWLGRSAIDLDDRNTDLLELLRQKGGIGVPHTATYSMHAGVQVSPEIAVHTALTAQKQAYKSGDGQRLQHANDVLAEVQHRFLQQQPPPPGQ